MVLHARLTRQKTRFVRLIVSSRPRVASQVEAVVVDALEQLRGAARLHAPQRAAAGNPVNKPMKGDFVGFMRAGKEVDRFSGADAAKLEEKIEALI